MEQFCLDCSASIKGRADKKYCNDQCRANHHNHLKAKDQFLINRINQILRKNRAILKSFEQNNISQLKREDLLMQGFNFNYHTHIENENQDCYYCCYEFGYLVNHEESMVKIRKK